jgi:hypothetical protein
LEPGRNRWIAGLKFGRAGFRFGIVHLSDSEKRLIVRLKKRQMQLIRLRWIGLVTGTFSLGLGIFAFVVMEQALNKPDVLEVLVAAWLVPTIYIFFGAGAFLIAYVIILWNGKPEIHLLLRLIEESQKDDV